MMKCKLVRVYYYPTAKTRIGVAKCNTTAQKLAAHMILKLCNDTSIYLRLSSYKKMIDLAKQQDYEISIMNITIDSINPRHWAEI